MNGNEILQTRGFWICAGAFIFVVAQIVRFLKWRTKLVLDRARDHAAEQREFLEQQKRRLAEIARVESGLAVALDESVEIVFFDGPKEGLTVRPMRSEIAQEWLEALPNGSTAIYRLYYKVNRYGVPK